MGKRARPRINLTIDAIPCYDAAERGGARSPDPGGACRVTLRRYSIASSCALTGAAGAGATIHRLRSLCQALVFLPLASQCRFMIHPGG